ncbi:Glycosyl transferase, family 2 [Desulfovibrio sp. TomC]|nr:Glycosyl transferase, family 2 [Desulfovibrio sp. TomC]
MDRLGNDYELVLVGNRNRGDTTDPTPAVVQALAAADPRIIALSLEKRGMMGWDARTGLAVATGDIIALIDGDYQMPPEDLEHVCRQLIDDDLDLAMTCRAVRKDGLLRRINSRMYNLLFRALFPGYPVRDVNSKPKAMTRAFFSALRLTADGWFLDAEIIIQARRHKARLGQIETVFHEGNRKSFVRPDAVLEFLRNLLAARFKEFFIR